jgi:hypothetical protein
MAKEDGEGRRWRNMKEGRKKGRRQKKEEVRHKMDETMTGTRECIDAHGVLAVTLFKPPLPSVLPSVLPACLPTATNACRKGRQEACLGRNKGRKKERKKGK